MPALFTSTSMRPPRRQEVLDGTTHGRVIVDIEGQHGDGPSFLPGERLELWCPRGVAHGGPDIVASAREGDRRGEADASTRSGNQYDSHTYSWA
jgi:hypothetical protein